MATAAGAGGADDGTGAYTYKWPRPGLTVLHFANNHAVYAITWLALAAMAAAAAVYLVREERRRPSP